MKENVTTFLKEGNKQGLVELFMNINNNLTAEDKKMIYDLVSKAVDQIAKELQSLDEVRKIIINGLVTLGQCDGENARFGIETLSKELDRIAEEKKETRKDRRMMIGGGLLGLLGLGAIVVINKCGNKKAA